MIRKLFVHSLSAITAFCMVMGLNGCVVMNNQGWEDLTREEQQKVYQEYQDAVFSISENKEKKKVKIEIRSAQNDTLLAVIEEEHFVNDLSMSYEWEMPDQLPEGLEPEYKLVVLQEETLLYGQDPDAERAYVPIVTFTTYKDSDCVQLHISVIDNGLEFLPENLTEDVLTFYFVMPEAFSDKLKTYAGS